MNSSPAPGSSPQALIMVGDPGTSRLLSATLALAGYRTAATGSGAEALPWLAECHFHLVVLDVTLPDLDDLKQSSRFLAPDRPAVLLLTGAGEFLGSLPGGAGPDGGRNRVTPVRGAELRYGDLVLDDVTCRVRRGSRPIELTPAEYRLLRCLLANAGQVLSKDQIGAHVWQERPTDGAVERLVSRLRRKVNREEPGLIHTRRGFGYWLGRSLDP